LQADCWYN